MQLNYRTSLLSVDQSAFYGCGHAQLFQNCGKSMLLDLFIRNIQFLTLIELQWDFLLHPLDWDCCYSSWMPGVHFQFCMKIWNRFPYHFQSAKKVYKYYYCYKLTFKNKLTTCRLQDNRSLETDPHDELSETACVTEATVGGLLGPGKRFEHTWDCMCSQIRRKRRMLPIKKLE